MTTQEAVRSLIAKGQIKLAPPSAVARPPAGKAAGTRVGRRPWTDEQKAAHSLKVKAWNAANPDRAWANASRRETEKRGTWTEGAA